MIQRRRAQQPVQGPLVVQLLVKYVWRFGRIARRKPLGFTSAMFILIICLFAVFADVISPHDPLNQYAPMFVARPLSQSPDGKLFILGGDSLGRDMFARVIYGARTSLTIGLASVALAAVFGSLIGLASGFIGGKADTAIQRLMDITMALPPLILALLISSVLGPSTFNTILAIAIVWIPTVNRVVRGSTLSTKQEAYVESAAAIGCSNFRVVIRHILPNISAPIIVLTTTMIGLAILLEASLSFLGLGTPPPTPSWGSMVSGYATQYMVHYPQLLLIPGAALTFTVLSFNLAGDTLRDMWDPKLAGT